MPQPVFAILTLSVRAPVISEIPLLNAVPQYMPLRSQPFAK